MRRLQWTCLFPTFTVVIGLGLPVSADPFLDQAFEGPFNGGAGAYNNLDLAQTFTVGTPGRITRVEIPIGRLAAGATLIDDLHVDIRPTVAGVPVEDNAAILTSATVPRASIPITTLPLGTLLWIAVDLPEVAVFGGDALALTLQTNSQFGIRILWSAEGQDNVYEGGARFARGPGGLALWREVGGEFGFRVFLEPPPPPVPTVGPIGLIGLAHRNYRLRYRPRSE